MFNYKQNESADDLEPAGSASDHGLELIDGNPAIYMRIDYGSPEGPLCSGIWACDVGKFNFTYPYTEFATLLEGNIVLTDSSGNSSVVNPGDSFFAKAGEVIQWEVISPCKKSFLAHIG